MKKLLIARISFARFLHDVGWWVFSIEDAVLEKVIKGHNLLSDDELEKLIRILPPGYHRSEMRIIWKERIERT